MQQAKVYAVKDICPEKVVASPIIIESNTQNKYNVHHNLAYPGDAKDKNEFHLQFPTLTTSPLNATTGDTGHVSLHVYANVYGNYALAYEKVTSDLDKIVARLGAGTSETQYKDLLFLELEKRGVASNDIAEKHKEEIENTGVELNEELFRYLMTGFLIEFELQKDIQGTELAEGMKRLKESYCLDLDSKAKQSIKTKIYNGIGIPAKKLQKSSAGLVDDILKWQRLPKNHATMPGLIDYSRSPQIHLKVLESVPKETTKVAADAIFLSANGQVLWARYYNYMDRANGNRMNTAKEFDILIYRKGDNMQGKPMFNLFQKVKTVAPSVYWSQAAKRGEFQFKITEGKVFEKIVLSSGSRTIPADERDRDIEEYRAERERLGLGNQQQPEETNKRSFDDSNAVDYNNVDMDALIQQDNELQQQEMKKRKFS